MVVPPPEAHPGSFAEYLLGRKDLYGAIVVSEKGAWFSDPKTGAKVTSGATVDVHLGAYSYRDASLILADNDPGKMSYADWETVLAQVVEIGARLTPMVRDVSLALSEAMKAGMSEP